MSILYTIALCAVFMSFIAVTLDAVLAVSGPVPWVAPTAGLSIVPAHERRSQDLRYVGCERRGVSKAAEFAGAEVSRRAA